LPAVGGNVTQRRGGCRLRSYVAAAEVAVGLAIIVTIFRLRRRLSIDDLSLMRW